ncbi:hypothetical protein [Flavobacterium terrigena]|uniref:Cell wall anchor protein n=1 Tax=Flavobacterium terrigena TaxID=402734 RepID=A0A1H6VB89_9FLAO|nr:hypothetical protein [Flavobacterium terrigena]SEJ00244.1 hypothetical protein SAMN05660918_2111 [Flavobacterium terrigena]
MELKTQKKIITTCLLIFFITTGNLFGQVGIGTVTPDASSMLDISSTTQGMLTPRMTTLQRTGITSPANGLLVYDTDVKSFYHYNTVSVSWVKISSQADGRLKYKLIKSTDVLATVLATELTAGGGSKYLLDSTTLYEINGTITLNFPLELNNAYLTGGDSGEDKLIKGTGDLFTGTTGGTLRLLTLVASSGNIFNIDGGSTANLIFRDCIVASSANVGLIKNFALVFVSVIQYIGNTTGIIYENVSKLLLSNTAWFSNNLGIYEKLVGTFGLIDKQGGFSEVVGTNIGFDVSSNPTISSDAVLEGTVFTGTPTTGKYINAYTVGTFAGYNFNNKWNVRCAGIPTESDAVATGDINFDYPVGSGATTTLSPTGTSFKLTGTTTSNNLFRFSRGSTDNRLQYLGSKKRYFRVSGAASFQASATSTIYIFFIAKNGVVINQSKVYLNSNSVNDILAPSIETTVELSTNDYIEVFAQRFSGTGNILTVSLNAVVN